MASRPGNKRTVAIVLAFLAATALVLAAVGPRWLAIPGDAADNGFGLLTADVCSNGCRSFSLFGLVDEMDREIQKTIDDNKERPANEQRAVPRRPWHGWPVVGLITFFGAVLAAAGLFAAGVLAVLRKRPALAVMPTTLALLGLIVALVAGCVFTAVKPDAFTEGHAPAVILFFSHLGVGWTFISFGVAIVLGIASVFPLNRQIRPIDDELGAASATMSWGTSLDDA